MWRFMSAERVIANTLRLAQADLDAAKPSDRPQPALGHVVASANRQALDGFGDARVEPQQLHDVADVARAEAGELGEVVASPRFTAIEDALPASREL